jgi:hypothetical protein
VIDPYDDPDWFPWDVESARRWHLPPYPGVPAGANWCSACQRLERRGFTLHNVGTAQPLDPPRPCVTETVHAVTVSPTAPVLPSPDQLPLPFNGFWCEVCRYLVPSATDPHPDERSRPSRTPDCGHTRIYRADVVDLSS